MKKSNQSKSKQSKANEIKKLVCVSLLFMGHVIQLQAQATTPDFGYADAGLIAVNHFAKLSNSNAELSLADSNSFGASVTNLGDLDGAGAGVTTIAVGTQNDNTGGFFRGAVYLVNINASGTIEGAPVKIAHGSSGISLRNADGFGASVANLGDLDIGLSGTNATNSLVTIAVGVPGADIGSSTFTNEGAIYLINLNSSGIVGTPVKLSNNTPDLSLRNGDNFGRSIANLGDLDGSGNGVVTLVAGLTGSEGQQVSIINLNSAGAVVGNQLKYNQGYLGISLHNQDNFGTSIESLGDLDIGLSGTDATNSVLTIAIGAPEDVLAAGTGPENITPYPNNGGSIYLLNLDASGSKVGDVIKIGKDTPGLNANHAEGFGASILNLSDIDGTGDGVVTLAVASLGIDAIKIINLDETGAIVGPVGTIRDGNISETISMFDSFGQSMVNIGDINGDGIDEIAVGTSNFDAGKGSVNIISFASKEYGLTTSDAVNIFLPIAETGEPAPAYALSPTSLPTGLTFNETARTITGTPTQDTAGKDYTLTATNSSGTDTFSFRLGVGNLAPALSSDNDLSGLALSSHTSGGLASSTDYHPAIITALTLQPAFSSSTTAYTISETLAVGVQAAIIFPTTSSSRATITVDGKDAASGIGSPQVILNGGDNIISVVVTAEDGTSKEYTITAVKTRPPLEINEISDGYINNAEDESDITISGTSTGIADTETITVTFSDSNITTKTATVGSDGIWSTTIPSAEIKAATEGTITVTATHTGTSTTATQTFKYDITPPTLASPIPDQEATVGRDFFRSFSSHIFTNVSRPTFVSTGQSNGITFTGHAWSGAGSSLTPGIVTITITAFDAAGNSASDEFTITISINSAPTIDSFSLTAGNAYTKTETLTFTNQENDEPLTAVWFPSSENNCNEVSYNAVVTSQVSGRKPTGDGIPITLSGTIADNSAGRTGDITYFIPTADSASDWNNRYVCAAVTDGRIVVIQRSDNPFELSKNIRPVIAFDPSAADTSDKQTFDLTINVTDSNADQTVTAKYKVIDSSDTCDATTTDTGATDITTAIGSTNGKTVTLTFNSEDDNGKKVCVNAEDHSGIPRDAILSDVLGGIASFARPRASATITGIDTTAPVLAATIDDQTATVGTDFTFTIPANTFTDSGTLTYTSSALTNGITFATDTWSGVGTGLTAGTVTITVTATDAAGNTATDEFDIVISGNNDPTDIALTSTTVPENTTEVGTFSTTDADVSDSHTYTLATGTGDEDNDKFTLNSATGVIAFTTAPDFENPTDAGDTANNNTYAIRVQTNDGTATFTKEFTITVTDVDETLPNQISSITIDNRTVAEGTTRVGVLDTVDPNSNAHTYTLVPGSRDSNSFVISNVNVLSFKTAPDYESPTDTFVGNRQLAGDNKYLVTIETENNFGHTRRAVITITVTDYLKLGGASIDPALWVKANDGITENASNVITGWTDQSPSAVAGTPSGSPVLSSSFINFNPTVLFDGTNDYFEFNRPSPISGRKSFTFIAVAGQNDISADRFQFVLGANRGDRIGILFRNGNIARHRQIAGVVVLEALLDPDPPVASGDIGIVGIRKINGDSHDHFASYQDGAEFTKSAVSSSYTPVNTTSTFIGRESSSYRLNGQIAELVVFEDALSEADLDKVQTHLAIKYGITLDDDVANYVNSSGASVFANSGTYVNDIVGIAKDDTSVLDQRISKSKNGGVILTISTDATFTGVNSGHTGSLTDGQYLIIGNDGGATTTQTTETPARTTSRITREWKVENTGSVGEVNLKFDGFDNAYTLYTDDDGDFSTGATLAGALNANGEIAATFSNGVSYFTLTTAPPDTPTDITLTLAPDFGYADAGAIAVNHFLEINSSSTGITLASYEVFGSSVANLGDLDGNGAGVTTIAVGVPNDGAAGFLGLAPGAGAVHIINLNSDGTILGSVVKINNDHSKITIAQSDAFGSSIANLGDLDIGLSSTDATNSLVTIAVGVTGDDTGGSNKGALYLINLDSSAEIVGTPVKITSDTTGITLETTHDNFGASVANLGDLDGATGGVTTLAVGANGDDTGGDDRGAVHIINLDSTGAIVGNAVKITHGSTGITLANFDKFGISVANLGDLDGVGSGVTTIAVGATGDSTGGNSRGALYLINLNASGGIVGNPVKITHGSTGISLANFDNFGSSVGNLKDLDGAGDGVTTLAVGVAGKESAYIINLNSLGAIVGTVGVINNAALSVTIGDNDKFGSSIANLGDLDGDGTDEIIVGEPNEDTEGQDRGAVHIISFAKKIYSIINGDTVDITLPAAEIGTPAPTYALTPSLPTGLRFTPTTRKITGTPTSASAAADYTLTASNSAGTDTFVFSLEVIPPPLTTWTGTTDSNWTTGTNWTDGVPTATHNVLIPKTDNRPTAAAAVTVNKVTINSGASLIANSTFSGNITYNRNIDFVSGNSKGWYLMASPVAGETYDDTYVAANDIGQGSLNNRGIGTYNTSTNSWEYFQSGGSGTFVSGKGYSIKKQTSTGAVAFTGTLNTDDVGVVLETTATKRFNLLGNPYPSYLNSTTFLNSETAISEEKTLWVWNQEISMYEAKNLAEPLMIAPGQGFFVKANTGGGTFNFSKANQSHTTTDTFQKSEKTQVKLDITDGDNHKNYCKIYYSEETTSGFDVGYDGELFSGAPNPFAIYTHLVSDSEGKHYQIQSLPYSDIENMVIPVGINAASGKEISISADVTNFPAGVHLYLEDKLENSFTKLSKNGAKYTVTLSDDLEGIGRFFLRASSSDLSDFSTSLENISVYTSSKNNLRIVGIQDGNVKLRAYNILGAQIIDTSFKGNGKNDVAIPSLAAGIYIIHLEMAIGKVSRKVVVE